MRLRAEIDAAHTRIRAANDAASTAYCLELLDRLQARHSSAVSRIQFCRPNPWSDASRVQDLASSRMAGLRHSAGAVAEDGAGVVSATAVATAYREASDTVNQHYMAAARGPGKFRALSDFLLTRLPRRLDDAAATADESHAAHVAALNSHIAALGQEVAAARGREKAAAEALTQERRSFETALGEQTRTGAATVERLKGELELRTGELDRLSSRFDKLLAASEAQSVRADDAAAGAREQLAAAHARIDELQSARVSGLLESAVLSQRLAEAEAARGALERQAAELRLAIAEEARAAASLALRTQVSAQRR